MIMEFEVRDKLIAFLREDIPLNAFEDWLVSESWNMHLDSPPDAQDLVAAIELELAEYSSGHLKYSELRNNLLHLLDNVFISVQVTVQRVSPARLPSFAANAFQLPASVLRL